MLENQTLVQFTVLKLKIKKTKHSSQIIMLKFSNILKHFPNCDYNYVYLIMDMFIFIFIFKINFKIHNLNSIGMLC